MKREMKLVLWIWSSSAMVTALNAAISIDGTNSVGFDSTTSAVVDNTGNVIADGSGFVSVGSFGALTETEIQGLSDASAINANFDMLSSASMGFNGIDGIWSTSFEDLGDTSSLSNQLIYTLIGNGVDIQNSDQFFIYAHSSVNGSGRFIEDPGNNTSAVVAVGAASTGSIIVGGHGNFQHDFGGGGSFDAFNLVTVPEPSSLALLGLGLVGFTLRRRR